MKNITHRVKGPDTRAEAFRRETIEAAKKKAAAEYEDASYQMALMDPLNPDPEAMARRDAPVEDLSPAFVEMLALGKPTEWALSALGPYVVKGFNTAIKNPLQRLVNGYIKWTDAGVPEAKAKFLSEMAKSYRRKHPKVPPAKGKSPISLPAPEDKLALPSSKGLLELPAPVEPIALPGPSVAPKRAFAEPPKKTNAWNVPFKEAPKHRKTSPMNAFSELLSDTAREKWRADMVRRYGEPRADAMLSTLQDSRFPRFWFGDDVGETIASIEKYEKMRDIIDAVTEPNEIFLGGSAGISADGTIVRKTAVPHDLDFTGYIEGASRRSDYGSKQLTDAMVKALSDRTKLENAPVIRKLRQLYPELKDAKFRYPEHDWQWSNAERYRPGVFSAALTHPTVSPEGRATFLFNTMLGGNKVDIMLSDGLLESAANNPRLGNWKIAFDWKKSYARRDGSLRPKDVKDIAGFREFSEDNPLLSEEAGIGRYSPFSVGGRLVDENGLPMVYDVPLYPGGPTAPVVMNTKGEMLLLERPGTLELYQNVPIVINGENVAIKNPRDVPAFQKPADAKSHPLVAVRGADREIRANGFSEDGVDGEGAPSIGVYPARDDMIDNLVHGMVKAKNGGWATEVTGRHKDLIFYPRKEIDPQENIANYLNYTDAFTGYPHIPASLPHKYIDSAARSFGNMEFRHPDAGGIPHAGARTMEIDNVYRNYVYSQNPKGAFGTETADGTAADPNFSEAKPMRFVPDGVRIPGRFIDEHPDEAAKLIRSLIEKMRFALPVAAAGGAAARQSSEPPNAWETAQDAKGGQTVRSAEAGGATEALSGASPTEVPEEPAVPVRPDGPRIVVNPTTFHNGKDALCVAFNELFRIKMEQYGWEPQAEPTERQRRFFADTAYADDEVQLRRTITARILTLDTSVKDPTDEQLLEAGDFLDTFRARERPTSDWERSAVERIAELVASVRPKGKTPDGEPSGNVEAAQ